MSNDYIVTIAFPVSAEDRHTAVQIAHGAACIGADSCTDELAQSVGGPYVVAVQTDSPGWLTDSGN